MAKAHNPKAGIDYAAYGCKDGECMYSDLRNTEENRRQLVLRAAKELRGHRENTAKYLDGLETGMKKAGAMDATAMRLRYEVAAIIASYPLTVEVDNPKRAPCTLSDELSVKGRLDFKDLEAAKSWQGLVNTARSMRNAATQHKRLQEGLPRRAGRGNHTVRKFQDDKFDKLREQLIERTAANQALDLLDAAIVAVANAYAAIASDEIETLREMEQRIHDKVIVGNLNNSRSLNVSTHSLERVA